MQLKKIALVFLVVVMMFSLAAIGIAAEGAGSEFSLSAKVESDSALSKDPLAVKPGDIIEFVVNVDSNPGDLYSLEIRVSFDKNALEFQGVSTEDYGVIFEKNDAATRTSITTKEEANAKGLVQVWLMANTDYESDAIGEFVTLRFKVAEGFDGDIENLDLSEAFYGIRGSKLSAYSVSALPAVKAHNYGAASDVPGDCYNHAKKVYTCTHEGCGDVLEVYTEADGAHICGELVGAVAQDCEKPGNVAHYICEREGCGKFIAEDKVTVLEDVVIPADGHDYGNLVAKVPATTEKEGTIAHYLCSVCGKYFNESKAEVTSLVIPKLPKMISVPEDSVWVKGSETSLSFVSNAKFEDFVSVKLNGALVSESDYKLEKTDDGTKITLEPATLEKLSAGDYTITITSANGSCDAGFTVENNSSALAVVIVIIAVVVIVAGAAAAIVVLKKKNII